MALGCFHDHRCRGTDHPKCRATWPDAESRHGRRHSCAIPVWLSVCARLLCGSRDVARAASGLAAARLLALGGGRCWCSNCGDGLDACSHGRPLFCSGVRLYQDRAGASCVVRPSLSGRHRHPANGGSNSDRHCRGGRHGAQARNTIGRHRDTAGARGRCNVCDFRGRLSRCNPELGTSRLRAGGEPYFGAGAPHPDGAALRLSSMARNPRCLRP